MIDLNADLGEHYGVYRLGDDAALLKYITSANIACGFHAGDPDVMHQTVLLCKNNKVNVGAHPGYEDIKGFGRRYISMTYDALCHMVVYQIGALQGICDYHSVPLRHVKPHGALYNYLAGNYEASLQVVEAIHQMNASYIIYGLSGSETERACKKIGVPFFAEVFSDRGYTSDGSLVDRGHEKAFVEDVDFAVERMLALVKTGLIKSVDGLTIRLKADTICLHGDGQDALDFAQKLHHAFHMRA